MRLLRIIFIVLIFVLIFGIYTLKNRDDGEESFTISDQLLSYEDDIKKDEINSIYIFHLLEEKEVGEVHLGDRSDRLSMDQLVEELSGINIKKVDKERAEELQEDIGKWYKMITDSDEEEGPSPTDENKIICQINPSDERNWGKHPLDSGPDRIQDKITDEIYIFSNGNIVFKIPEEMIDRNPKKIYYEATENVDEKLEKIINLIDSVYFRRNPKIES